MKNIFKKLFFWNKPKIKTAPGRNAPCPCGSGKKFKKCCMSKFEKKRPTYMRNPSSSFS